LNSLTHDPDRWVNPQAPGAHEWWYFDAISDDGRDAFVVVWYATLPFDPVYGLGSLRHISQPDRYPKPDPLDHCAIGFSWYRDGKTMAYALNAFERDHFSHRIDHAGLNLRVSRNSLTRDNQNTYLLNVETPVLGIGKKTAEIQLEFKPKSSLTSWERNLGSTEHPHLWILAAADCQVNGQIQVGKQKLEFSGRGYHDHNAGEDELSRAFHRWHWGRFHRDQTTQVYYVCEPVPGESHGLWLECDQGIVKSVEPLERLEGSQPRRTVFGIKYDDRLQCPGRSGAWSLGKPVDQGPFYLRWVSENSQICQKSQHGRGFSELLQADKLHQPWFNWMIPYRLKRPRD
jgi:carotenoid 1,2-hydratase